MKCPGAEPVRAPGKGTSNPRANSVTAEIKHPPASRQSSRGEEARPSESLLIGHIQAHIRKGDQAKERATQNIKKSNDHYIAAGRYLAILKANHAPTWEAWETLLKTKVRLSTGRASELMQLADGRKDLQQIREGKAESVRAHRSSLQAQCSEEGPEEEDEPEAISPDELSRLVQLLPQEYIPDEILHSARQLITHLINPDIREVALKLVLVGDRQSQFQSLTEAVADLYQRLAGAGR